MSKTMSLRLREDQLATLEKWARRFHQRSISATLSLLLEEKLREEQHSQIAFRDSPAGREAHVMGSGLAVWEVVLINRAHGGDVRPTAGHLGIPAASVQAALRYAADYPEEINAALEETDAVDFTALQRILPDIQRVSVPSEAATDERAG
jgi:uncharacterized protein (DUF433 family)